MNQATLIGIEKISIPLPLAVPIDCERLARAAMAVAISGKYLGQRISAGNQLDANEADGFLMKMGCLTFALGEYPERSTPDTADPAAVVFLRELGFYSQHIIATMANRLSLTETLRVNVAEFQSAIRDEFCNGHFHKLEKFARLLSSENAIPLAPDATNYLVEQALAAGLRALEDDKYISATNLWKKIGKEVGRGAEWARKRLTFDNMTKQLKLKTK